ncbi:MAG: ribosome biogenesis factor YjgA [Thermodesulfobacteriota bacterium]
MAEKISRSEQKRRHKQVGALAEELTALSDKDLKTLEFEDEILDEIKTVRTVKGGARKRQVKYLAKLLHTIELDPVYEFLKRRKGSQLKDNQQFHEAERLRDAVINEALAVHQQYRVANQTWDLDYPSELIPQAGRDYRFLDPDQLRKSTYQYAKTRNKVHYRELFRMIKAAIEQQKLV